MLNISILVSVVLLAQAAFSQQPDSTQPEVNNLTVKVRPDLPSYTVSLIHAPDLDDSVRVVVVREGQKTPVQSFLVDGLILGDDLAFQDINFDGFLDLQIMGRAMGSLSSTSSFWLFDSLTGHFEESKEFSGFGDVEIDREKQEIESSFASAGNCKYVEHYKYKVLNHHPILIEQEMIHGDERERKELASNGSWIVRERSTVRSVRDSLAEANKSGELFADLLIVTAEDWQFDSLRVVSETRERNYFGPESDTLLERGVLYFDDCGRFRMERETTYQYSGKPEGPLYVTKTIREVVEDRWVTRTYPKYRIK